MKNSRYPIGEFHCGETITKEQVKQWIQEIEHLPAKLEKAVAGLHADQLDTPYRAGGWTVRQVVHHVADSHMNGYMRFKLALTEHNPSIKTYKEEKWAELSDSTLPVEVSLTLLKTLHQRWVHILYSLQTSDFEKTFHHPESGAIKLVVAIGLYAWHGRHHTAHITALRNRLGW
ncbi:YfiT family bacillithiol transferase [Bacillus cytotoxicus]|uniref:Putative metal-dependent hydrolase BCB44BAC_02087 n=1 Tax=Bacillus cytotoxicus TaxID=580165 RepID=A0AAX2CHA5_9BACI|nr:MULTISPECIES: bacillithiol transferase BstA [Bacillus cereus group]AWC28747.1 metal-dependent hydrolase [Bacillus cytotoxicus]AWC32759.1 metal-dependent hydrolase [Bacillus cytotoxicus]AWC36786.1 metal-dependent hydrolase [Bacillus cytotoxicus]AWC39870.1 metal-dependent hydrolase [Bacillus cytotoxicus]AWC47801.1 metal-dependent hydrolase [Bacillus cytotoxicus]